jgi:hypothetical protein
LLFTSWKKSGNLKSTSTTPCCSCALSPFSQDLRKWLSLETEGIKLKWGYLGGSVSGIRKKKRRDMNKSHVISLDGLV